MYKLVCIDMDGTLLSSKKRVSAETKKALIEAHKLGVHIVITTGRLYTNAEYYSNLIGVKSPVIAANGAIIREKETNEIICKCTINTELAGKILEICRKYKVAPNFHTLDRVYTGSRIVRFTLNLYSTRSLVRRHRVKIKHIPSQKRWMRILEKHVDNIVKCEIFHWNSEKISRIKEELQGLNMVEVVSSSSNSLEITAKSVSKGKAVEFLAGYYGINRDEIMAIGDSENDFTMLEYAGLGVAMGNASTQIKERADYVTDTNDNDGIAKAINRFILNKASDIS